MDIVERLRDCKLIQLTTGGGGDEILSPIHIEAADEIERLREEIEDMHRRERSTALQHLGNEGQWCDLFDAKNKQIERLRTALRETEEAINAWLPRDSMIKRTIIRRITDALKGDE